MRVSLALDRPRMGYARSRIGARAIRSEATCPTLGAGRA
jgi:hypothetical protein